MSLSRTTRYILPGFGVTLSVTLFYLFLFLLFPLGALAWKALQMNGEQLWILISSPRVLAACRLSIGAALAATLVNVVMGPLLAWVLVRYNFPGRSWLDALIDLPVALPTAVAGLALSQLYSPEGWLGKVLEPLSIKVAYTRLGVFVALIFVGVPFLVRAVQPVLAELDRTHEEAALTLGATPWQSFRWVLLPQILPAILTGSALAFGRAVGEYGSVIFIAGNVPFESEIAPLLIVSKLEQYDYSGATAIALILLSLSILILLLINRWQESSQKFRQKELAL
jgi:sulfate transport system permease protein